MAILIALNLFYVMNIADAIASLYVICLIYFEYKFLIWVYNNEISDSELISVVFGLLVNMLIHPNEGL